MASAFEGGVDTTSSFKVDGSTFFKEGETDDAPRFEEAGEMVFERGVKVDAVEHIAGFFRAGQHRLEERGSAFEFQHFELLRFVFEKPPSQRGQHLRNMANPNLKIE